MSRMILKYDFWLTEPRTWSTVPGTESAECYARIKCPRCQNVSHVFKNDHHIDQNGLMHPSFTCAKPKCGWSSFLFLKDWPSGKEKE